MPSSSPATMSPELLAILTDHALLQRFLQQRDEAAFALLVRRHGPMVRATCRRCLGETPDLDDAFQAVFLVLARKGGSIRQKDLLGPWLHMVALRAARKLRAQLARRLTYERPVMPLPEPAPFRPPEPSDWLPMLDEELRRLPDKFSGPLVLCELEGRSRTEAAGLLGVPEGTLSSRLARGRDLLRQRLVRRGVTAPALALTTALSAGAAVALPATIMSKTIQAATTGAADAAVTALTQGVIRAMFLAKCKSAFLIAAIAGTLVVGLLFGASFAIGVGKGAKSDKELLQGTWQIISAEIGGKQADDAELAQMKEKPFVFKGDKVISKYESEYQLDTTKNPKWIDLVPLDGPPNEKGKTFRGVYRIEGDKLTICFGVVPDGDRPSSLTPPAGEVAGVLVLKRVKDTK
jgi:RNA polymerase sigma factor (sigma-70 family)